MTFLSMRHGELHTGRVLEWSRGYTRGELDSYEALSARVAAPAGTAVLPDLLVVAPLTKLGGDLNYIARKMTWTHSRPVALDERLTAELEIVELTKGEGFHRIVFDSRIRTGGGEVVLNGRSKGIIPDTPGTGTGDSPARAAPVGSRRAADDSLLAGIAPGAVLGNRTTVTPGDIARCADLTGDRGAHHIFGRGGRQVAQGLLTATAVPLLRGDRGFHCHSVSMVFLQPVYAGDSIVSRTRIEEVQDAAPERLRVTASVRNEEGSEVMVGEIVGSFGSCVSR